MEIKEREIMHINGKHMLISIQSNDMVEFTQWVQCPEDCFMRNHPEKKYIYSSKKSKILIKSKETNGCCGFINLL